MSPRMQKLLARVNWYLQSSLKHITELITGNKSYHRGGRYRQVSLYPIMAGSQGLSGGAVVISTIIYTKRLILSKFTFIISTIIYTKRPILSKFTFIKIMAMIFIPIHSHYHMTLREERHCIDIYEDKESIADTKGMNKFNDSWLYYC